MHQIEKLKNGLTLMRIPVTGVESVSTVVFAGTGSRYEKTNKYGLAHFLEHMVFKGTKLYPSTKVLSETVDSIGAQFNAFTSEEGTAFYIRSASQNLDLSLKVLGQLITQALILPEEIDKERGVIFEEMHMYEDQPANYNAILFNQMFYAKSGLAHNILGEKATVAKIEQADFQDFLRTWYGPDNLLIVVAGKKEAVLAADLAERIEANFIFSDRQTHPDQSQSWEKNFVYGERLHFEDRPTEQIHFILGWPGITNFDQRENVLALLSVIIGGNMSSRLFLQVREQRGLCYYINSQSDSFSDAGFFGATAGVNPDKLVEAVQVTVDQFMQIATGKQAITEAELIKAKNYLSGNLVLAQESTHNLALSYGMRYLLTHKVVEIETRLKEISQVSLEEIQALAAELVQPAASSLSLIGRTTAAQKEAIQKIVLI